MVKRCLKGVDFVFLLWSDNASRRCALMLDRLLFKSGISLLLKGGGCIESSIESLLTLRGVCSFL